MAKKKKQAATSKLKGAATSRKPKSAAKRATRAKTSAAGAAANTASGVGAGQRIFADVMNTRELSAHQKRDGIVLLPLGCFEMHNVHMGMSTDTFLVEAACRVLAPEWKAVIYPPIHYCYPGASTPWPGTVSVTPRETIDYVIAIMNAILENGVRRLVLVSLHGPNAAMIQMALREVFETTGEIAVHHSPDYGEFCRRVQEEFGQPHGEAAMLLASLYMCGRHGEFDPSATKAQTLEGPAYPFKSAWNLRSHGVNLPYYFVKPNNHVGRYPGLTVDDAPRLAEIYTEVILEKAKGLPQAYEKYQKDMWKAMDDAPWDKV